MIEKKKANFLIPTGVKKKYPQVKNNGIKKQQAV